MSKLEDLQPGLRLDGVIPAEIITVIAVQWHGADALELTYKTAGGGLGQQVVFRKDEGKLARRADRQPRLRRPGCDFKLVAEAPADLARRPVRPDAGGRDQ